MKTNRKATTIYHYKNVMRHFLLLPVVLGVLLVIVGGVGIKINSHSSLALFKLNDTVLGPTLVFNEISKNLHLISEDILRLNKPNADKAAKIKILMHAAHLLQKTDGQLIVQMEKSKGLVFENYLKNWYKDWTQFKQKIESDLKTDLQIKNELIQSDFVITSLIDKMTNIDDFIQADVEDMLTESTRFSERAGIGLLAALFLGLVLGFISSLIIIKGLRRLFLTIEEANKHLALSSKLASLGEMSAGVAHEINNPLAIIMGATQLLPKFINNPEKFATKIEGIEKSCARISKIIDGLRKFSRADQQATLTPHSLSDIVKDVLVLTEEKSKRHDIIVTYNSKTEALIDCDEIELQQVIVNLIYNAIDAAKKLPKKWVNITVYAENKSVVLEVTDSGSGIPEEIRAKLFDPFFTTKKVGESTGLGLSISRGILDEHNASIEIVAQAPNTCFKICFPESIPPL